jgi:hypothetical protein
MGLPHQAPCLLDKQAATARSADGGGAIIRRRLNWALLSIDGNNVRRRLKLFAARLQPLTPPDQDLSIPT